MPSILLSWALESAGGVARSIYPTVPLKYFHLLCVTIMEKDVVRHI